MSQLGKFHPNNPSNNGIAMQVGDIIGDPSGPHQVVVSPHPLNVPGGGFTVGYSDQNVHARAANGYSVAGLGPQYVGSINGRADATR